MSGTSQLRRENKELDKILELVASVSFQVGYGNGHHEGYFLAKPKASQTEYGIATSTGGYYVKFTDTMKIEIRAALYRINALIEQERREAEQTAYKSGFSAGQDSLLRSGQSVPSLYTEEEVRAALRRAEAVEEEKANDYLANERVREAETRGAAFAIGVIDELHIDADGSDADRTYKRIKNTIRDRFKAETGVDPAPSYPINAKLNKEKK